MKNIKNKQLINSVSANLIGILGTILGVLMFAGSLFLYSTAIEKADINEDVSNKTIACAKYTNGFHNTEFSLNEESKYEANISGSIVNIRKENVVDGKNELLEIENIIANCKNMELIKLCIGQVEDNEEFKSYGCSQNGLNVTLRYKETWTYKPVF